MFVLDNKTIPNYGLWSGNLNIHREVVITGAKEGCVAARTTHAYSHMHWWCCRSLSVNEALETIIISGEWVAVS